MPILTEAGTEGKRRRFGGVVLSLILVIALWAVVALALYQEPREAAALNTPGAILGITRGTEALVIGSNWRKWLMRLLPQYQAQIGGVVLRSKTAPAQSLVVWQNAGVGAYGIHSLAIRDEQNHSMQVEPDSREGDVVAGMVLSGYEIARYPRRGEQLYLRPKVSGSGGSLEQEWVLPNPAPGPYPVWEPEPVPATRKDGALEVTLERLFIDDAAPEKLMPQANLELRLREHGQPAARRWEVESVTVADSTGNSWRLPPWTVSYRDEERMRVGLMGTLQWTGETAYRVQVEVTRKEGYPPSEVWTLPSLPIPAPGEVVALKSLRQIGGLSVDATSLVGAGTAYGGRGIVAGVPAALLKITGPLEKYRLRGIIHAGNRLEEASVFEAADDLLGVELVPTGRRGKTTLQLTLTPRRKLQFLVPISHSDAHKGNPDTDAE